MKKTKKEIEKVFKSLGELRCEYFPKSFNKETTAKKEEKSYGVILADEILNEIKKQISQTTNN
jgi:hypothetical protein